MKYIWDPHTSDLLFKNALNTPGVKRDIQCASKTQYGLDKKGINKAVNDITHLMKNASKNLLWYHVGGISVREEKRKD